MAAGPYRLLDHTADLGLEIFGQDLPDLFVNACFALFDNISDLSTVAGESETTLAVTGDDTADLLVNWLRELLGLWTVDRLLVHSARITDISETELTASLYFDRYNADRHVLKSDIKAVTYHHLAIERQEHGWTGRVILDV